MPRLRFDRLVPNSRIDGSVEVKPGDYDTGLEMLSILIM